MSAASVPFRRNETGCGVRVPDMPDISLRHGEGNLEFRRDRIADFRVEHNAHDLDVPRDCFRREAPASRFYAGDCDFSSRCRSRGNVDFVVHCGLFPILKVPHVAGIWTDFIALSDPSHERAVFRASWMPMGLDMGSVLFMAATLLHGPGRLVRSDCYVKVPARPFAARAPFATACDS